MKVKTKYNINDTVWFMSDNKIQCGMISGVGISVGQTVTIMYSMYSGYDRILEEKLFKTKQELLNTL